MAEGIRIGIIGGGWPGKAHARGYLASGGFKLMAVADLIPSRRREMMDQFKVAREYATWEELIADKELDAVSICLPTHLHAAATLAAVRAGKHIVVEKPIGRSSLIQITSTTVRLSIGSVASRCRRSRQLCTGGRRVGSTPSVSRCSGVEFCKESGLNASGAAWTSISSG